MTTAPASPLIPDRPFRRVELLAQGMTKAEFYQLLRDGVVRSVVREAFVRADLLDTVELRASAVAMVIAEGHVVVDRTAAAIHGVDVFTSIDLEEPPPVETCALRSHHLRRRDAMAALNAFARDHGVTVAELRSEVAGFRRRRGVVSASSSSSSTRGSSHFGSRGRSSRSTTPDCPCLSPRSGSPSTAYRPIASTSPIEPAGSASNTTASTSTSGPPSSAPTTRLVERGCAPTDGPVIVIRAGDFTGQRLDSWLGELRAALAAPYTSLRW